MPGESSRGRYRGGIAPGTLPWGRAGEVGARMVTVRARYAIKGNTPAWIHRGTRPESYPWHGKPTIPKLSGYSNPSRNFISPWDF